MRPGTILQSGLTWHRQVMILFRVDKLAGALEAAWSEHVYIYRSRFCTNSCLE